TVWDLGCGGSVPGIEAGGGRMGGWEDGRGLVAWGVGGGLGLGFCWDVRYQGQFRHLWEPYRGCATVGAPRWQNCPRHHPSLGLGLCVGELSRVSSIPRAAALCEGSCCGCLPSLGLGLCVGELSQAPSIPRGAIPCVGRFSVLKEWVVLWVEIDPWGALLWGDAQPDFSRVRRPC
ncbi:MAG: hypothetical protein ACI87O_001814, partial [Planctomycetota bacterium]